MLITLTTDFGLDDPFVAMMKGVILRHCPQARLVDICHTIPPQNIGAASHILFEAAPYFPGATVHMAVVDPGVGTSRRIICIKACHQLFLAPDNGLLSPFFKQADHAFHLTNNELFLEPVSATFHGRDIFAPVAAALAGGLDPCQLGPPVALSDLVRMELVEEPNMDSQQISGQCLRADHFGNMATNISKKDLDSFLGPAETPIIHLADTTIKGLSHTYDLGQGRAIALINSSGHLEISLPFGNAVKEMNLLPGSPVVVKKTSEP